VSSLLNFSYPYRSSSFYFMRSEIFILNYDGCEEIFLIFFKCAKCVIPGLFSGTFFKKKTKIFSFYFLAIFMFL
jgi:hypothetical protein